MNDDLDGVIEGKESALKTLESEITAAKSRAVAAKDRERIERRLAGMVGEWKKRKSLCLQALEALDDASDGVVSKVKCLKGQGQVAVESDEMVKAEALRAERERGRKRRKVDQDAR